MEALSKEMKDVDLEKKSKIREMNYDFSGNKGFSKEFREQVEEQKQWLQEKREIVKLREEKDRKVGDLIKEKEKLLKLCHPTYNRLEDLEKGVKIINKRIETSTITPKQEKELIAEIKKIEESRPYIL